MESRRWWMVAVAVVVLVAGVAALADSEDSGLTLKWSEEEDYSLTPLLGMVPGYTHSIPVDKVHKAWVRAYNAAGEPRVFTAEVRAGPCLEVHPEELEMGTVPARSSGGLHAVRVTGRLPADSMECWSDITVTLHSGNDTVSELVEEVRVFR